MQEEAMPTKVTNPYGKPSKPGNGHEIWQKMRTPCPECGATEKRLTVENDRAKIVCGKA